MAHHANPGQPATTVFPFSIGNSIMSMMMDCSNLEDF